MDSNSSPPEGAPEGDGEPLTAENSYHGNSANGVPNTNPTSSANMMFIELHYMTKVPPQWCHPDSGGSPEYSENVYGWELDIMYPTMKNDSNKETEEDGEQEKQPHQLIHTFTGGRLHDITTSIMDTITNDVPPNMKVASERAETVTDVPGPSVVSSKHSKLSSHKESTLHTNSPPSTSKTDSVANTSVVQKSATDPNSEVQAGGTSSSGVPPASEPAAIEVPAGVSSEVVTGVVKTQKEETDLGVVWSLKTEPPSDDPSSNTENSPPHIAKISLTEEDIDIIQHAVDGNPFQFQLRRVLRTSKASPDWEDVNESRYRVVGTIPMTGFAEPGVDSVIQDDIIVRPPADDPSREDKKGKKAAPKKPVKGSAPAPAFLTTEEDFDSQHPYDKCGTRIRIKIGFEKAIVCLPSERPKPGLVPADVIPKRVRQLKKQPDASTLLTNEVKEIVSAVVSDYRKFTPPPDKAVDEATNRASFLRYLNTSGRSFAHRQKLKHCIIKIVKEKFSKRQGTSAAEMEPFYNELYVYLLDQIHYSLNSMLNREELQEPGYQSEEVLVDKWLRLATEAEIVHEYEIAEKYHQERLVHGDPSSGSAGDELPTVWGDFARYYLRMRDAIKAEQALKEAIAIDFSHTPSLVAYGLLLLCRKREKEAEVFLQAAVDVDLTSATPWACLSLYYERLLLSSAEPEEQHSTTERWAKYTHQQALRAMAGDAVTRSESEPATLNGSSDSFEMYKLIVDLSLSLSLEVLTEHSLDAIRKLKGQLTPDLILKEARMYFQLKQLDKMRKCIVELLQDKGITSAQKAEGHLLLGEAYSDMGNADVVIGEKTSPAAVLAEENFDQALRIDESLVEGSCLFKLGNIYYSLGRYDNAKDSFISAAKKWPTSIAWMGVGIASYRSANYDHAEQALNESNVLNNLNPKTWAFISLVCLKQSPGREEEADQAFHQALKLGLTDAAIFSEIGVEQFSLGRLKLSEAALTQSLSQEDLPMTHLLLARTFTSLRRFEEAKHHYKIVKEVSSRESEIVKATQELEHLAGLEENT